MNLLAIDTSSDYLSLAISRGDKIICSSNIPTKRKLSSMILPSIKKILQKADMKLEDLTGFVVGLGPGSFTSLRVGLATIKGLSFALKKSVVGIPSLDALAFNAQSEGVDICVITDARRNLVYAALYQKNGKLKRKGKYVLAPIEEVLKKTNKSSVFTGNAISLYKNKIKKFCRDCQFEDEKKWNPKAKDLILLARKKFEDAKYDKIDKLIPLYLYPEDCQVRK